MSKPRERVQPLDLVPLGECWRFTVLGAPRTKKNHQRIVTVKATGKQFIVVSASSAGWEKEAVRQLKEQWLREGGLAQPVRVTLVFYREKNVGDFDNYKVAANDAIKSAGILVDDKWILSDAGSSLQKDRARPRVEIEIETIARPEPTL